MKLAELLRSLTAEELRFIAGRDYGQHEEQHLQALNAVVASGGEFPSGEYWYPYEVVELTAHQLVPGHEREFAACNLLVLAAVASGHDTSTDLEAKFADRAEDYGKLPPVFRDSILSAYAAAGL